MGDTPKKKHQIGLLNFEKTQVSRGSPHQETIWGIASPKIEYLPETMKGDGINRPRNGEAKDRHRPIDQTISGWW